LCFLILLLWIPGRSARAQAIYYPDSRLTPTLSVYTFYQHYNDDDRKLTEISAPVSVFVPVGSGVSFRVSVTPASANGPNLESLGAFGDTQLGVNYLRPLGPGKLAAGLNLNLPSGKKELTVEEFQTSLFLSQNFLGFRAPSFGQGFNAEPNVNYAVPVAETVVAGLGASYRYRGTYTPLEGLDGDYQPGSEIELRAGVDVELDEGMILAGAVRFVSFATDKLDGDEAFTLGDMVAVSLRFQSQTGPGRLLLFSRFIARAESEVPGVGADARTVPNEFDNTGRNDQRLDDQLHIGFLTAFRMFGETINSSEAFYRDTLQQGTEYSFDLGLEPAYTINEYATLVGHLVYTFGGITGFNVGLGTTVTL
jgi:hypothetical protein